MNDPEFDELKREFLEEAAVKIQEIGASIGEEGSPAANSVERAIYLAHQLKGAGGSYGFQTISTDATALERFLEKIAHGGDMSDLPEIRKRIDSLSEIIAKRTRELSLSPSGK
jgi:chemotaxis protein histidine kinase CheA